MYIITRRIPLIFSNLMKSTGDQLRNFVTALNQQQVTAPIQETFTGRILLYLNTENGTQSNSSKPTPDIVKNALQNQKQLHKISTKELLSFSNMLADQKLTRNELRVILKHLDTECSLRLHELDVKDILALLNVYINLIPNRITDLKFYKYAVKILHDKVVTLNKRDFLKLIFYVGLTKKSLEAQTILRECMRKMDNAFIENLSTEELCIICNAAFKTSTKIINRNLLESVRIHINDNLSVLSDTALFVTLIKTLRHNRYQNEDLLNTISYTIFFNKTSEMYSFPIICHVLALYADYFFYDENLFKMLTQKCLKELTTSSFLCKQMHPSEHLRGKDIKRFLWIMSMFSEMRLVSQSDIRTVIVPKLIERIKGGDFMGDLNSLIDITLYLWMLNYQPFELLPFLFAQKKGDFLSITSKSNLRLSLLLHTISVENPDLLKKFPIKTTNIPNSDYSITYQLPKRPLIKKLLCKLQGIQNKINLHKFLLSQEIPHLNIVGITGYRSDMSKAVHIEVLDDYTRIKNIDSDVPVGLMALKLKLLEHLPEGVLVVSQREADEMTDEELEEYLIEELKLIC